MYRILIVEDDTALSELLKMNFSVAGYAFDAASDGHQALQLIEENRYDLAVMDIMIPGPDGFELLPYMTEKDIPVIYISARTEVSDRVRGLKLGAEDYLTKPFSVLELLVRMEKVLSRRNPDTGNILTSGDISVHRKEHTVYLKDREVELKPMEYALLLMFMKHKNIVFTRDQLLKEVWGDEFFGETRTVDNHVAALRKKLALSDRLVTVYRVGYRFEEK